MKKDLKIKNQKVEIARLNELVNFWKQIVGTNAEEVRKYEEKIERLIKINEKLKKRFGEVSVLMAEIHLENQKSKTNNRKLKTIDINENFQNETIIAITENNEIFPVWWAKELKFFTDGDLMLKDFKDIYEHFVNFNGGQLFVIRNAELIKIIDKNPSNQIKSEDIFSPKLISDIDKLKSVTNELKNICKRQNCYF